MSQWTKVAPATKPADLSLIPETNMTEGENPLLSSFDLPMRHVPRLGM